MATVALEMAHFRLRGGGGRTFRGIRSHFVMLRMSSDTKLLSSTYPLLLLLDVFFLAVTGNRCKHIGYDHFNPAEWNSECAPHTSQWIDTDLGVCGVAKTYPEVIRYHTCGRVDGCEVLRGVHTSYKPPFLGGRGCRRIRYVHT